MAKINVATESTPEELEELISNISTYSNAQSRVSKVDLRSRNPQLVLLKSLSESIVTPSGRKWFFERAKGEFSTKLRINASRKKAILKEFPSEKRFSKEQLAKYYTAWGDVPYMVKKGGEKVFRAFIEEICGDGSKRKPMLIDRTFYEELVAKVIMFRGMEKIYGQGKNSMGQIRAAVVPYSIAVLFSFSDGSKESNHFDLLKIWKLEKIEDDLEVFVTHLLRLVNDLIKKYALSDDLGEYSKKPELWDSIIGSPEIKEFMESSDARTILQKYELTEQERKKRLKARKGNIPVDFGDISSNALIYSNGEKYYSKIAALYGGELSANEDRKLNKIIAMIQQQRDLDHDYIQFERGLINSIRINQPEVFDNLPEERDDTIPKALDFIIGKFNSIVDKGLNLESEFEKIERLAEVKGHKYTSVFNVIRKQLAEGIPPKIEQLVKISPSFNSGSKEHSDKGSEPTSNQVELSEAVLRKMVEWASVNNVLSQKEIDYVATYAFGIKKISDFSREKS